MKSIVIIALLVISTLAHAAPRFMVDGKEVTKIAAVKALMKNPSAHVQRVQDVELTDKLTLKNRKATDSK